MRGANETMESTPERDNTALETFSMVSGPSSGLRLVDPLDELAHADTERSPTLTPSEDEVPPSPAVDPHEGSPSSPTRT